MERYSVQGNGWASQFTQILLDAGCDLMDEQERGFGVIAYNLARMIWNAHHDSSQPVRKSEKVGRNEPCPCGSGLKYKKCCASKTDESPAGSSPKIATFNSDMIPLLWSVDGIHDACNHLSSLLTEIPVFKEFRFSTRHVREFLKNNMPPGNDVDRDEWLDDIAVSYVKESDDKRVLVGADKLMIAASKYAKSAADIRALAAGYFFATTSQSAKNSDFNILIPMLFRRAIGEIVEPTNIFAKISKKIRKAAKERFKTGETPSEEEVNDFWDSLSDADKDSAAEAATELADAIWQAIRSGKLPVGLPFATILPLYSLASKMDSLGKDAVCDQMLDLMKNGEEKMTSDDYRLYDDILCEWLRQNDDMSEEADLVNMTVSLVKGRALKGMIPGLLVGTMRGQIPQSHLPGEEAIIASWGKELQGMNEEELLKYAEFMEAKGYPQIAKRTRELVQSH
jgi:hypothetical protein